MRQQLSLSRSYESIFAFMDSVIFATYNTEMSTAQVAPRGSHTS